MRLETGRRTAVFLTRQDVESELRRSRQEGRVPRLSGNSMIGGDFSHIDFTSDFKSQFGPHTAELLSADFRNARLDRCNFSRADLASANLRGTILKSSSLAEANLYTALLEEANLENADLRGANLTSAELEGVRVAGADFEGARFGRTAIGGVDLSGARNLDLAVHFQPSSISAETMRLTAAGLGRRTEPERLAVLRFFLNSGIPQDILDVVRSWIGQPIEFYSVFLSHSSLDKEFARRLYADLRAVGVNCWFDEKQILPGDNILTLVDQGIKAWDKLLLVCSKNSLSQRTGWWVEQEIERALAKERELRHTGVDLSTLIPITIDDFVFVDWSSRFKATVSEKHVGDFRNWKSTDAYTVAFERLRAALGGNRRSQTS